MQVENRDAVGTRVAKGMRQTMQKRRRIWMWSDKEEKEDEGDGRKEMERVTTGGTKKGA